MSDECYFVAQMRLEINSADRDLENIPSVVFHNRVVRIRTTQATFDVGLFCFCARYGSL
jgi:hypothetical protein